MQISKKLLVVLIPIVFTASVIISLMLYPYDQFSSSERVFDFEDSKEIKKLRGIPEVEEFIAKHMTPT